MKFSTAINLCSFKSSKCHQKIICALVNIHTQMTILVPIFFTLFEEILDLYVDIHSLFCSFFTSKKRER
ncbi:hypothetical protein DERF_007050 [Dermatophagoides farinae]|uniref:Uncharacterized protein n=1 Tax=Dermatophagoides farinae TaxID=6954 RepID=A0A922L7K5_DERFA|nr:hypothetical protein DERF_007050 [Dermatophagoides farinae]